MIPERLMPNTSEWDMYIAEHRQRYEFAAEYCVNAHVLDAACGVGYGSDLLHRKGAFNVLGVDLSSEAIQYWTLDKMGYTNGGSFDKIGGTGQVWKSEDRTRPCPVPKTTILAP